MKKLIIIPVLLLLIILAATYHNELYLLLNLHLVGFTAVALILAVSVVLVIFKLIIWN
jgi:hypothetical protein